MSSAAMLTSRWPRTVSDIIVSRVSENKKQTFQFTVEIIFIEMYKQILIIFMFIVEVSMYIGGCNASYVELCAK